MSKLKITGIVVGGYLAAGVVLHIAASTIPAVGRFQDRNRELCGLTPYYTK